MVAKFHPRAPRPRRWRGSSRRRLLLLLVTSLPGAVGCPPPAAAQDPALQDARRPEAPDSSELLARARSAQRRFETTRREHLPISYGSRGGTCDDRVGRMCWYHDTGGLWTPEPEDERITEAREQLLVDLAGWAESIPGDDWILGQRVHYLTEVGRFSEAADVARRCRSVAIWWCRALEGLALHGSGRFEQAAARFAEAKGLAPVETEAWDDLSDLLDSEARSILSRTGEAGPEELEAMQRRLWMLADPLYLVEGNDRLTEHHARHVLAEIRSEARNPHGISWGDDMAELLLRYGGAIGWERPPPGPGYPGLSSGVTGHEHPDSRSYLPPGKVLEGPALVPPGSWVPALAFAPSAYAPRYAPVILPVEASVAVFARGDRAVVATHHRLPPDTTLRARRGLRAPHEPPEALWNRESVAGLFAVSVDSEAVYEVRVPAGGSEVLSMEVPSGEYWVSVEVWDPVTGIAGRARQGLGIPVLPPDVVSASDLLLLEEGPEPADLEEALGRWRADHVIEPGDGILVGWEVWGLGWRAEQVSYRLSVREPSGGFFRRAGRWLGLVGDDRPVVLEWSEPAPDEPGPSFRSVHMELPELDPGSYLLRLELATPGRGTVLSERRIEVTPSTDPDGGAPG